MRAFKYVAVCGLLVVLMAGSANADPPRPPVGIAPMFNDVAVGSKAKKCGGPSPCTLMTYHGGPVMHRTTNYVIFWQPSGYTSWDGGAVYSTNYKTLIAQYFTDLEAASGARSNIYGALTQYCNGASVGATNCNSISSLKHITTTSTYGGSWTDTQAFPASGCTDPLELTSVCLTDAQLSAEAQHAIDTNGLGWTKSRTHMFFIYTPRGVTSCFGSGGPGGICAYNAFCGYHNNAGTGSRALIYADMPYPIFNGFDSCEDSGNPQYPNGDAPADIVLSTTSHEHNEAISDPEPDSGWWDAGDFTGGENGDKCAYYYGATAGTNGSEYNQTIHGDHYYLQLEWSNADDDCVETYGAATPAPIVSRVKPKSGVIGQPIGVLGKNLTGVTDVKINGTPESFATGKKLSVTVGVGTTTGNLVVTAAGGDSNGVLFTVDPSPIPVVKSVPQTAHAGGTVKISGKHFYAASSVTINGTPCSSIAVSSASKLTCMVGGGTTSGTVDVTTPGGTGTSTKIVTIS